MAKNRIRMGAPEMLPLDPLDLCSRSHRCQRTYTYAIACTQKHTYNGTFSVARTVSAHRAPTLPSSSTQYSNTHNRYLFLSGIWFTIDMIPTVIHECGELLCLNENTPENIPLETECLNEIKTFDDEQNETRRHRAKTKFSQWILCNGIDKPLRVNKAHMIWCIWIHFQNNFRKTIADI